MIAIAPETVVKSMCGVELEVPGSGFTAICERPEGHFPTTPHRSRSYYLDEECREQTVLVIWPAAATEGS